ncbi:MAG: MarR family transcriptional regulator [Pseudolabrys sp.]
MGAMQPDDSERRPAAREASDAALAAEEFPCNNLALRQASRRLGQIYDRHFAAAGLRGSQYSILSRLNRLGPMTVGRLAEAMVIERTALGRALKPLQRDKFIAIAAGNDARIREVSLTNKGKAKFEAARRHWLKAQAEFEAAYGADDAAALRAALRRVVAV